MADIPALSVSGKVYVCPTDPPRPCGLYVYQKTVAGAGNIPSDPTHTLQLRRHVIPADPRTSAQLARRARFALAVATWHAMAPSEKAAWKQTGTGRKLPGYHAFLSNFLLTG